MNHKADKANNYRHLVDFPKLFKPQRCSRRPVKTTSYDDPLSPTAISDLCKLLFLQLPF